MYENIKLTETLGDIGGIMVSLEDSNQDSIFCYVVYLHYLSARRELPRYVPTDRCYVEPD